MIAGPPKPGLSHPITRATLLTDKSVMKPSDRAPLLDSPPPTSLPEASAAASGTRQRRKAARPQELLEAALTLFVSRGLAATRSEDVAKLAGVSKGTLYLYYPSKDELFKAVVRAHLTDIIVAGEDQFQRHDGSTVALLHELARTWWQRLSSSRAGGLLLLMLSEAKHFPELAQFYVDEVVVPSQALVARVIQLGIDRGEFRAGLDVTNAVHALVACMQFLIIYREGTSVCVTGPVELDPERFIEQQINLLLHGMLVRTDRRDESLPPAAT